MLMLALTPFPVLVIVFFAGIIVFHLLEPLAPIHKHYRAGVTRRGYFADVVSLIVNGPGLDGLTTLLATGLVLLLPAQLHLLPRLGWWGQLAVFFIVNDFLRYWIHRWYHESNLLWRVHRVHHAVVEMDAMSVFRFHILEGVIKNCIITLPFQLLGVDPWVVAAYSAIDIIKGFWHHANLRTYIGPLNYVLNSPEQHWWHHSVEARGQRSNYGSTLSIWDWIFGTAYWPRGQWPEKIGVEGLDAFPNDYLGQFTSPVHADADYQKPAAPSIVASAPMRPAVAVEPEAAVANS